MCGLLSSSSSLAAADDANIWEEDMESESNIRYDKNGQVIGATLNKLVERVTSTRDHGEWEGRGGGGGGE